MPALQRKFSSLNCALGAEVGVYPLGVQVYSLPDQVISMNDLPPAVKPLAGAEVAGCKIKEVTKGVRSADGTYIYTITYSDQAGTLMEIKYKYDGTLISKAESQQSRTKPSTATE